MASGRDGRLRSIAWEHFTIKDKEKGIATCNICHEGFSFRTSVSNLMKHLKNKHGYVVVKGENYDENEDSEMENENGDEKGNSKPKQVKTELWEYYQVKDEANKLATCNICLDQISYKTSMEDLFQHLQVKHAIHISKGTDDDQDTEVDEMDTSSEKFGVGVNIEHLSNEGSEAKGRRMSSIAWDYFSIKDEDRKVASCNLCGALCSYRTSVSNLMKHARRKHGVAGGDEYDDGRPEDTILESQDDFSTNDSKIEATPGAAPSGRRSIVWLYFKPLDNDSKLSECLLCKKTLSHSSTLTNLKKHLERRHPDVEIPHREDGRKRILLSSGGELYEVDSGTFKGDTDNSNQHIELDTVYLEDFELQDDEPLKNLQTCKTSSAKKRTYSSSSEEEITFINRYKKKTSDSFDHFGKYTASLLRNLPKEKSSFLQGEFIKQILIAQRESDDCNNAFGVPVTGTS